LVDVDERRHGWLQGTEGAKHYTSSLSIDQIKNIRFIYQWISATKRPSDPAGAAFGLPEWAGGRRFAPPGSADEGNKAMTTLTTSVVPVPFAKALAGFAAAATRLGNRVVAAWRHRGDVTMLASFDERMLRDIGLTRGDLNDALAEPMWRDPTAVLVRRQCERRAVRVSEPAADLLPGCTAPSIVPLAESLAVAR
jgi:uncharacterized protein YjiS (DUF1127 family)